MASWPNPAAAWPALRRRPRWQQLTAAGAALAVLAAAVLAAVLSRGTGVIASEQRIEVVDGPRHDERVSLDATLFVPEDVGADQPAPAVIVGHGFGGSKQDVRADARYLAGRGFVVLTYSARGFGASTGQIALNAPDYEVADARQVVDWLAARPEVAKDSPGDPRVGVTGASYGGALALLLAGYDQRVDAVVPIATWHDLSAAFFPNFAAAPDGGAGDGVFKRLWAGLFFGAGQSAPDRVQDGQGTPDGQGSRTAGSGGDTGDTGDTGGTAGTGGTGGEPDLACGRFVARVCQAVQDSTASGRESARTRALLRRSSPVSVLDRVRAPTLLIQGETDSLFPLSEADATARALAAAGTTVQVAWFAGGHDAGAGSGLAETDRLRRLTARWFGYHLRGEGTEPGGAFQYARVNPPGPDTNAPRTRTFTAPGYPGVSAPAEAGRQVRLYGAAQTVLNPPGGTPAALSGLPRLGEVAALAGTAGTDLLTDLPGQHATFESLPLDAAVDAVGAPSVTVRVVSPAPEAVLFAKLYDVDPQGRASLPGQAVAPLRVGGLGPGRARAVRVTLPAVVHRFDTGHRIRLVLATTDQGYAGPTRPAAHRLSVPGGGILSVPRVAGSRVRAERSPVPWLAAGALAVALAGGAAFLAGLRRRRRGGADTDPGLLGVPLVVEGLTKTYGNGEDSTVTAVDGLSFRVERGQVLGLLGPNGAGKTTTLRILMGLIHPTSGRIRVFGTAVTPGAPVLSRLGSFVEGPGFLPHLSGMDNLVLYWRATGRALDEAHLDEALRIAGLGAAVHRRVRTYSQGMRQRLAIAQAMLGLPDLLVLDEPTNGLDPPQMREMRQVLRDYAAGGRTVLVSSHLLAEVEQTCTHVVVMHRGRLVAEGSVAAVVGGADSVRVDVDDPARAARVLRDLDGVKAVAQTDAGLVVTLGTAQRRAVVAALVGAGVGVDQLTPRRRLEDAFLSLVGEQP